MEKFKEIAALRQMLEENGFTGYEEFSDIVGDAFPVRRVGIGYGGVACNIVSAYQDEDEDTVTVFEECFLHYKGPAKGALKFFLRHKGWRYYKPGDQYFGPLVRKIGIPDKAEAV